MVQKIARLSEEVINKIAAGEVVENPASIAKELIENSLDAGALCLDISIEGGGCRLLQIEDDGCGMGPEDALLSLERHATSKIRSEQDLFSLATMGFRGEALAAVAAVSQFEMRTSDGVCGTQIAVTGGERGNPLPCARNRGTTVTVRDLFFNVPARKKFLKSLSANTAALTRTIETIALAHPEVSFILKTDGKTALQLFPEETKNRIENLAGPMPHEVDASGLRGFLAAPEEAKVHRRGQFLFVNRRPVYSHLISRAVKAGLGTRISEHSYPSFVLFLEVAPNLVDVNVHPQKKEVRFAEEGKIFCIVEQAVAKAIAGPAPVFSRTLSFPPAPFSFAEEPVAPSLGFKPPVPLSFDFPVSERPLAVVDGYFFLQAEGGLLLIDLRLARARILYESLKEKKDTAQALMWPIQVAVDDERIAEELQAIGIECRLIGKHTLAVDALPSLLDPDDFSDFLNAWREGKKLDAAASRYAKGAKKKFTLDEAFILWRQLLKCRETAYDPAGRRIWDRVDAERLKKILEER
jgi:DNA mismatch repair protein MutL